MKMRYLPLTPPTAPRCWPSSARRRSTPCSSTCRQSARWPDRSTCPARASWRSSGRCRRWPRATGRRGGPFFCGAGAYRHHVPASVDHLIQRSEFLTSYTPYQPEIAQGTLQALFEFQTQVAALTGLPVANASMYDGSTACAEAVMMAARVTRRPRRCCPAACIPHYAEPCHTLAHTAGVDHARLPAAIDAEAAVIDAIDADTACVVVQTPNVFGTVTDVSAIAEAAHAAGALLVVVTTEAVSLGLLKSPGEMGADIAVAEGQSIGNG
jgi:glycine dehydrogenase subunit 1